MLFAFLVLWSSIYSVLWIRSTDQARKGSGLLLIAFLVSKTRPFEVRSTLDHSKTGHVQFPDPHCSPQSSTTVLSYKYSGIKYRTSKIWKHPKTRLFGIQNLNGPVFEYCLKTGLNCLEVKLCLKSALCDDQLAFVHLKNGCHV